MTPEHFRDTVAGWRACHEACKAQFDPTVEAMVAPHVTGQAATYWRERSEKLLGKMVLSRLMRSQVQEVTPETLPMILKAYVTENLP